MSFLSSVRTPQNHLWSLFFILDSASVVVELSNPTSAATGVQDKTAGQPFCIAAGCLQGGIQGGGAL